LVQAVEEFRFTGSRVDVVMFLTIARFAFTGWDAESLREVRLTAAASNAKAALIPS
jgi:hypothetical protein